MVLHKNISSFYLCIDMGDLIYSLLFSKILGVDTLFIDGGCGTVKFNWQSAEFLLPFIKKQPYIKNVELYNNQPYDYNYGLHPNQLPVVVGTNLTEYHASKFELQNNLAIHDPWLIADTTTHPLVKKKEIIINRTPRYRGNNEFYNNLLQQFNRESLLFLGLPSEHELFCKEFQTQIDYIETPDILDLATIINSVPAFVGNQSLICSLATGLGRRMFIEYGRAAANYVFSRNIIHYF